MGTRKDQHKVGRPVKPRGQQTGFAGNPDQNREEMENTPALRGRRKRANKMFADESEQHVGGNAVNPSTNSPSTPAANPMTKADAPAERVFKQRMSRNK